MRKRTRGEVEGEEKKEERRGTILTRKRGLEGIDDVSSVMIGEKRRKEGREREEGREVC